MKKNIFSLLIILCLTLVLLTACGGRDGWLVGDGAPSDAISASIGDFYLDRTSSEVYQLTAEGWVRLVCETRDSEWFSGDAVDGDGDAIHASVEGAAVGDLYLNTVSARVYECTADGVWKYLTSLEKSDLSVTDLSAGIVTDTNGERTVAITVTYSDGSATVSSIPAPLAVEELSFVDSIYYGRGTAPHLRVKVRYENGDVGFVNITEGMYVIGDGYTVPDFTTLGTYKCRVGYLGAECEFKIEVVDLNDTAVKSIAPRGTSFVIMRVDSGGTLVKESLTESFTATLANGTGRGLSRDELDISFDDFSQRGTTFVARVSLKADPNVYCELTVLPLLSVDDVPYSNISARINSSSTVAVCADLGELPADDRLTVTLRLTLGHSTYETRVPITKSMLSETSGAAYEWGEHSPKLLSVCDGIYGAVCENMLMLELYSRQESSLVGLSLEKGSFRKGMGAYEDISLRLSLTTKYGTPYEASTDGVSLPSFSPSMLLDGTSVNFNLAGEYKIRIFYDYDSDGVRDSGEVLDTSVVIYDPNGCNIAFAELNTGSDSLGTLKAGDRLVPELKRLIVGKTLTVGLYEYSHLESVEIDITQNMLDTSRVPVGDDGRILAVGRFEIYIKVTLDGVAGEFTKTLYLDVVADVAQSELYQKLYLNGSTAASAISPFTVIYLFDNGTALLNPYLTSEGLMGGYASYAREGNILVVDYLDTKLCYTVGALSNGTGAVPDGYYELTVFTPDSSPTLCHISGTSAELNNYDAYVYDDKYFVLTLKPAVAMVTGVSDPVLLTVMCDNLKSLNEIEIASHNMKITFNNQTGS